MQRTIELKWEGEALEVETTMKNAMRIETKLKASGTNLMRMSTDLQSMSMPYVDGVILITEVLRCGGVKIDADKVWDALFGEDEVDESSFFAVVSDILYAFTPKPVKKQKPAATTKTQKPKNSRSRKSTK